MIPTTSDFKCTVRPLMKRPDCTLISGDCMDIESIDSLEPLRYQPAPRVSDAAMRARNQCGKLLMLAPVVVPSRGA